MSTFPLSAAGPKKKPVPSEMPPPPIIIIDAGHGGKDPGAISKNKIREKDVVLAIAKRLANTLKTRLKAKVVMTRNNDRFVTLENRNRIANRHQCDLFLSIHANASRNEKAEGMEIYYLNKATDQASQRLASRENQGAPKKAMELEGILSDLIQTASTEESAELAGRLEKSLKGKIQNKHKIKFVHVKTALFYVLVGAKCPSLLIETGFITNPREGKRLKKAGFQRDLAEVLTKGVAQYLSDLERPSHDL